MDRLGSMSILLAVVEAGSLSAAARRLGMPLATVSRRVAELEAHLKSRLLTRTSRQLALTEAGRAYVAACRRILDEVEEAERAAAGEYAAPKGELIMTAPIAFGRLHLLPVVAEFLKAYREIDVRVVFSDRIVHLIEDHVDLAVRIGALPDSSFLARTVGAVRLVACASPAYLAERGRPAVPGDLAGHDCVVFGGLMSARSWSFSQGRSEIAVAIRPRLVVNTAEAAVDAVKADLGVTRVLSYQAAEAVESGAVELLLRDFEPEPRPVSLVHAGQGIPPRKLQAFLDFAAPRLRARLAAAI